MYYRLSLSPFPPFSRAAIRSLQRFRVRSTLAESAIVIVRMAAPSIMQSLTTRSPGRAKKNPWTVLPGPETQASRGCHEEGKGRESHQDHEEASYRRNLRKQRVKRDKQPKPDNHAAQPVREDVSPIGLVPLVVSDVQSTRWTLLAILRCRMMIEKRIKGLFATNGTMPSAS